MLSSLRLSPALARATDAVAKALDVGLAQIDIRHAEQRCYGLFGVVAEIGADDVSEHVLARGLRRLGRIVYVARPVLTVLDQLLLPEYAEHRPDRRIRRRIGKVRHDLGDSRASAAVKDVHHLPLAAGERGRLGGRIAFVGHHGSSHGVRLWVREPVPKRCVEKSTVLKIQQPAAFVNTQFFAPRLGARRYLARRRTMSPFTVRTLIVGPPRPTVWRDLTYRLGVPWLSSQLAVSVTCTGISLTILVFWPWFSV